jgi:hypothetical protein
MLTMRRLVQAGTFVLAVATATGCATNQALSRAREEGRKGDWDAAVVSYKDAIAHDPKRVETKIGLQQAQHMASAMHLDRARELERQDQISGAASEYRLAADLEPGNTSAAAKVLELERIMRDRIESSRPKSKIDELRSQALYEPPTLDPRMMIPLLQFAQGTAVRDILSAMSQVTGININYDQAAGQQIDQFLNRPFPITL